MLRELQYNIAKILKFPANPENDIRIREMNIEIAKRGGQLNFKITKDNSGWVAECENLKGIITGGSNPNPSADEINQELKDAIFTAFSIPPNLCKDDLIRASSDKVMVYAKH